MPKITTEDIRSLGFLTPEMFRQLDITFDDLLDKVISEQSILLEGRIGSTAYASTLSPTKEYIKRAEICLVAAELIQRRINIILGNVVGAGQEIDITHEGAQKRVYKTEADDLITKIVEGLTSDSPDFASGILETSHFAEETT